MASKKDMRRSDLVVPYVEPQDDGNQPDMFGSMSSTLPMAAIFTRNKMMGWVALVIAIQAWLSETGSKKSGTSGIFSVGMALMSLGVCYMQLFMPPPPVRVGTGSGTDAPPAMPA